MICRALAGRDRPESDDRWVRNAAIHANLAVQTRGQAVHLAHGGQGLVERRRVVVRLGGDKGRMSFSIVGAAFAAAALITAIPDNIGRWLTLSGDDGASQWVQIDPNHIDNIDGNTHLVWLSVIYTPPRHNMQGTEIRSHVIYGQLDCRAQMVSVISLFENGYSQADILSDLGGDRLSTRPGSSLASVAAYACR